MSLFGALGDALGFSNKGYQQQLDMLQRGAGLADPFASQRPQYQAQLSNLMANPSSIYSDPGYMATLMQGEQGLQRNMAAQGFTGSGNALIALKGYDESFANTYLRQQEQLLTQLAGGMSSGPSANPLGGVTQMKNQQGGMLMNTLGSLYGMMGGSSGLSNIGSWVAGLFGGGSALGGAADWLGSAGAGDLAGMAALA